MTTGGTAPDLAMKQSTTVYIETYGCQMNKLDSETVASILTVAGFAVAPEIEGADVVLLNTCGVRENAETRIHGRLGELMAWRKENPDLFFGVIGCMAQRLDRRLLSKTVRIVAGPDSYRRLPEMIVRAAHGSETDTVLDPSETYGDIDPIRTDGHSAWVAVMRGCNNFCSYCIVPYTRGRERSIPVGTVVEQVESLVRRGFSEVTLLGQNVNSYRDGAVGFAELLGRVADTGIPWVRFLTSHPADLTPGIITVMADRDSICPHLHLPLQSGSDRILAAMNRGYDTTAYRAIVDRARAEIPGVTVTTDMIFGFPGEREEDFRDSIAMMREIRFEYAFLYRYSEREGTKACGMPDSVPEHIRIERLSGAIELQQRISRERQEERRGMTATVLVKGPSKDGEGWFGYTEWGIPAVVSAKGTDIREGSFLSVDITGTTGASLLGIARSG